MRKLGCASNKQSERQQQLQPPPMCERERAAPSVRERASEGRHPCARESERRPRTLPFHFFAKRRLRRNFGSIPLIGRRCPLPSDIGFLMPLRWFLYDWLCAVWLVDLAIFCCRRGRGKRAAKGERGERFIPSSGGGGSLDGSPPDVARRKGARGGREADGAARVVLGSSVWG